MLQLASVPVRTSCIANIESCSHRASWQLGLLDSRHTRSLGAARIARDSTLAGARSRRKRLARRWRSRLAFPSPCPDVLEAPAKQKRAVSTLERAASTSRVVPISSITITCGFKFWTARIITSNWFSSGLLTRTHAPNCMRLTKLGLQGITTHSITKSTQATLQSAHASCSNGIHVSGISDAQLTNDANHADVPS